MLHCSPGGDEITVKNKEIKDFIGNLEVQRISDFYQFPLNKTTGKTYQMPDQFRGIFKQQALTSSRVKNQLKIQLLAEINEI